jgi:hypothetical protein
VDEMSEPSNAALERERRVSGKRRRPSGEPPPLPRKLGVSGVVWIGLAAFLFTIAVLVVAYATLGYSFDRWNSLFLQRLSALRAGWLDPVMLRVDDVLSSPWTIGILRLATTIALVGFRRWRHLIVFLASIVIVEALAYELAIFVASPRPDGVRIIGNWDGPSFPSPPVASLAVTLVGIVYTLVPSGRARSLAKWLAGGTLFVFAFAPCTRPSITPRTSFPGSS